MKLIAFYKSGTIRFFDLANSKCLGRYRALTNEHYTFVRFLPDGKHMFLLDNFGTIFLMKIEKWDPIGIQMHQVIFVFNKLFNLSGEILNFSLNPIDQYNKFLVNLGNVYLVVYNRKYTNLLKNLEYDNSIPQFALQDKFNVEDYFKQEMKREKADVVENFIMEFSPKDKSLVYILSQARKVIIIRHYEHHENVKQIFFNSVHPVDFRFAFDSSFIIYVLKDDRLQISPMNSEKGTIINYQPHSNERLLVSISNNSRLVLIASKNTLASYHIKLE